MKTLVCFGDSNTYGTPPMPGLDAWGRFAPEVRWPGIAAAALGADWHLIEEALPGRTTVHDDPIEGAHRNGLTALPTVLGSHRPIDLIVIALGTNDLKARFAVTPEDIALSVGRLVETVRASPGGRDGRPPDVMAIVPPPILEVGCLAGMFSGGAEKSRALGRTYAAMAARMAVPLVDAGTLIVSDPLDGIHFAADQHAILGRAIAAKIGGGL